MSKWISEFEWVCEKHFTTKVLAAAVGLCPESGCNTTRPRMHEFMRARFQGKKPTIKKIFQKPISSTQNKKRQIDKDATLCAYELCKRNNGLRAKARQGSKYCDDKCRKAFARAAYNARKRKSSS